MLHRIAQPFIPSSLLRTLGHSSNLVLHNTRDCRRSKINQIVDLTEHYGQIIIIHDDTENHYITDDTLISISNAQHKVTPHTFWLRPRLAPINYHIFPTTQFLSNLQMHMLDSQHIEYVDTEGFVTCGQFRAWQTLDFHTYRSNGIQFGIRSIEEPYPAYENIPNPPDLMLCL